MTFRLGIRAVTICGNKFEDLPFVICDDGAREMCEVDRG